MTLSQLDADRARAELYEIMRADSTFEEKVDRALELGEAYLDVQNAHLTRIDQRIDFWEAIASTDPPDGEFPAGEVLDLQTTYCRRVIEQGSTIALSDAPEQGWGDDPAFREHQLHCYHGTPLTVEGEVWGTLCFVSEQPRAEPFSESETLFAELIARLLEHEIRHTREAAELNLQSNLIGVLNRVLRHNLRNDLNVIRGQLTMLSDQSDEPLMQNEAAVSKIDKLVDLANTARQIESIASSDLDRQPVELNALVTHVIEKVESNHPGASITVEGPEEVYLEAIPSLRTGLQELIENAAKHSGDAPDVTVVLDGNNDAVQIEIIDEGPGLPAQEREVLQEGAESPLIHGSGLGLWLAYWIIANHDGSIHPEVTAEGTRITVTLPRTSQLSEFTDSESLLGRFHREQDKFEAVFEESFDAIVLIGDDGHYTDVNASAAELFGLSVEELQGRHISDFVPDEFDVEATWSALMDADRERDTFPMVRQDGTERIVEYTAVTDVVPGQHLAILRDVTERIGQEKELLETKDRLEAIIEASPDPIIVLDAEGVIQRWNEAAERVSGYRADDVVGESIHDLGFYPASKAEAFADRFERAMEGERFENLVVSRRMENGDEVKLNLSTAPLHDASGDVIGIVAIAQDVTERQARETELATARDRLEQALDVADAVVWDWEVESDTLTRVPATNPLYGSEIDDLADFLEQVHPEDRDMVQETVETAIETGSPYETQYRIERDGDVRWVEDYGEVHNHDGDKAVRLVGVARDVTGRVERERRFEALSKGFPDLCFVLDEHGRYREVLTNPANERLLIGDPDELVGQAVTEVLPAKQGRLIRERIERTVETGEAQLFRFELPVPAGRRLFEARTHPLSDPAAENRLVSIVVRDITEHPGGEERARAT